MNPTIIAISGGSGSGKSYLAKKFASQYTKEKILIISQDSYYKDFSFKLLAERKNQNYDHPHAIDVDLFQEHLHALTNGKIVELPLYNFKTHLREKKTIRITKQKIIVVEGILILHYPQLRKFYTIKIFVDTPEIIRFERRLKRDVEERGRTKNSVKNQYITTVKPMHNQFVEASKTYADFVVKGTDKSEKNIQLIQSRINSIIQ